jgi:peptide-methionine (S)-S-oxide reductase
LAIFWHSPPQKAAEASLAACQSQLTQAGYRTITTEIREASDFAEDYRQQYLADTKNPYGYCGDHGTCVSCPTGLVHASGPGRADQGRRLTLDGSPGG